MKQTVYLATFCEAFQRAGRADQFSREAQRVLFEYLEGLEEDCGTEFELDVIALCCDYEEIDKPNDAAEAAALKEEHEGNGTYIGQTNSTFIVLQG